jgi:ADP-heptose:LPS heptosyltransferase
VSGDGGLVVSPLSNDALRDWPLAHYRALAALAVDRLGAPVRFVGTAAQRPRVAAAVAGLAVANLCGETSWGELRALLLGAGCVVSNNSGVGHLAASLGAPTVCVFAASHDPYEWMPRGPRVVTLVKRTVCAPCGIGRLAECAFDHRCLREIGPELVFAAVQRLWRAAL